MKNTENLTPGTWVMVDSEILKHGHLAGQKSSVIIKKKSGQKFVVADEAGRIFRVWPEDIYVPLVSQTAVDILSKKS